MRVCHSWERAADHMQYSARRSSRCLSELLIEWSRITAEHLLSPPGFCLALSGYDDDRASACLCSLETYLLTIGRSDATRAFSEYSRFAACLPSFLPVNRNVFCYIATLYYLCSSRNETLHTTVEGVQLGCHWRKLFSTRYEPPRLSCIQEMSYL